MLTQNAPAKCLYGEQPTEPQAGLVVLESRFPMFADQSMACFPVLPGVRRDNRPALSPCRAGEIV